jgi:hypothetical protein
MENITSSREVFLKSLNREQQLTMLFDMAQAARNEAARDNKEHIEIKKDMDFLKGEMRGIGMRKDKTLTTSEKVDLEFTKRNAWWVWYRDHVLGPTLSAIHTLVILAILYLAFGGKIP